MRKLLLAAPLLAVLAPGCQSETPVGPGVVTITETTTTTTTTSTSTSTSTTTTIPVPMVASFTFSPVTPQTDQAVYFDASGSTPGTGRTIIRHEWNFGDGVTANGLRVSHSYKVSGIYLVTLTVTDDADGKASSSQPITVRPVGP